MNRSLLFILYVTILAPAYCFGMDRLNRGLPDNQAVGITGDKDTRYKNSNQEYIIFKHCGDRYAYQERNGLVSGKPMVHVFNDLKRKACAQLYKKDFDEIRFMGKQLSEINSACDNQKKATLSAGGNWLSKKAKEEYDRTSNEKVKDIEGAVAVAFRQGGGTDGLADALAFKGQLKDIHQNISSLVRLAKLKFYGLLVLASALSICGLYGLYQWWYKQDNTQEATEDVDDTLPDEQKTTDTPMVAPL